MLLSVAMTLKSMTCDLVSKVLTYFVRFEEEICGLEGESLGRKRLAKLTANLLGVTISAYAE